MRLSVLQAINFNRECKSLENGMVYNFSGHTYKVVRGQLTAEEDQNGTIKRDGNDLIITSLNAAAVLYLTMNNIRTSKLLRSNIVLIVVSLSAVLQFRQVGFYVTDRQFQELITQTYLRLSVLLMEVVTEAQLSIFPI